MRFLYFLALLLCTTTLAAQTDSPVEFASLHARYGHHTVVIYLTTEAGTEEFKYVDLSSRPRLYYPASKGWVNAHIQRQPEPILVIQLLNSLIVQGWRVDQFTSSVSNRVKTNYSNEVYSNEEIVHDYLLQRPGAYRQATAAPKRIVKQLETLDANGESSWLVVKAVEAEQNGVTFYRRVLELEKEYTQGHVVVSSNPRAILPYTPGYDPEDRFLDMYEEDEFVVLEHFVRGDTSRHYRHYFKLFNGVLKLDRVKVELNWVEDDCTRKDQVEYFLGTGRAVGEIVYSNCTGSGYPDERKAVNYFSRQKKRIPLFEFDFGKQRFHYGRRDSVIIPY